MTPQEFYELVARMRAAGASKQEVDTVLRQGLPTYNMRSEAELIRFVQNSDISFRNVGRAAVQGATLNAAGKLGIVDEDAAKQFGTAHPVISGVSEFAGGAGLGVLTGGAGAAVAARAGLKGLAGAATAGGLAGAAEGGAYGAINARPGERLAGARNGALGGAALGAAAPVGMRVAQEVLSPTARAMSRLRSAIGNGPGGADKAREFFSRAAAAGRGDIAMLGDATPRLRQEVDFIANANPDTRADLMEQLFTRREGRAERLLDDLQTRYTDGPLPAKEVDLGEMKGNLSRWAAENYGNMRSARQVLTPDEELANVLQRPIVSEAFEGSKVIPVLATGQGPNPLSVQQLSHVRARLRGKAEAAYNAGDRDMGEALKAAGKDLEAWISARVPEYRDLNAQYKAHNDVIRAYESASDWWMKSSRGALETAMQRIREMPNQTMREQAQEAARRGAASGLVQMMDNLGESGAAALDRLIRPAPLMKKKLRAIFGSEENARKYIDEVRIEREMSYAEGTLGGSPTALRGANESYIADGAGAALQQGAGGVPAAAASGVRSLLTGKGMTQRVAKAASPIIRRTGDDAVRTIDELFPRGMVAGTKARLLDGVVGGAAGRTLMDYITQQNRGR